MNDFKIGISFNDIEKFLSVHGVNGAKTVDLAVRHRDFYNDIQTIGGGILVSDVMAKMEVLLKKNFEEDPLKDDELAEYKAYKKLFDDWANKMSTFRKAAKKIKGE